MSSQIEIEAEVLATRYLRLPQQFRGVLLERLQQENPEVCRLVLRNLRELHAMLAAPRSSQTNPLLRRQWSVPTRLVAWLMTPVVLIGMMLSLMGHVLMVTADGLVGWMERPR